MLAKSKEGQHQKSEAVVDNTFHWRTEGQSAESIALHYTGLGVLLPSFDNTCHVITRKSFCVHENSGNLYH